MLTFIFWQEITSLHTDTSNRKPWPWFSFISILLDDGIRGPCVLGGCIGSKGAKGACHVLNISGFGLVSAEPGAAAAPHVPGS